jgi:alpha-beta hydrolase superfamily lysophospholipase
MWLRVGRADERPPRVSLRLQEARVTTDYVRGRRAENGLAHHYPGNGGPILVIPGMFAADRKMRMLRRVLAKAGYASYGWELGRNMPHRASAIISAIDARVDEIATRHDRPVTLIGWSLGGLIAREYAKKAPGRVEAVITLGSPFSGNLRHNNAWRAFELFAGHSIDASPFAHGISVKPPVHTTAIWSPRDGVIPPRAARGLPNERDAEVEVNCGHMGYVCAPDALEAVLRVLAGRARPS